MSDPGGGDPWTRFVELVPERFRAGMFRTETALDALLACMARGWTLPELAYECTPPDVGAGAGVIIARLRDATHKRPPDPEKHSGPFNQPLPWCGRCDNGRTRWFELLGPDGRPSGTVVRCPTCWVEPPHTSRWAPRCVVCGSPTRVRDVSGRPTCPRCL
jgi:hypothetical protein